MNRQTTASVEAIRNALPFENPNTTLLYLAIFGSQVRGTERPDSDLDIFFITDKWSLDIIMMVKDVARKAPDGIQDINKFAYSIEGIRKHANLYGSPIHDVLRGIDGVQVLYQVEPLDYMIKEPDLGWCALQWLDMARMHITPTGKNYGLVCFHNSLVIDYSLRSYLLYNGVRFPRTRDVRILYGMLPNRTISLDFDAVNYWRDYVYHTDSQYTKDDADVAVSLARHTYDTINALVNSGAPR